MKQSWPSFVSGSSTDQSARVAHDVSVAASHFLLNQLPELYTAPERNESNFPVQYIGANVPQAWAAGAVFMFTQALISAPVDHSSSFPNAASCSANVPLPHTNCCR
jgi:glycogen debranching enzyme